MSHISEINERILTAISKNDKFYQALWGKEDFVPESEILLPNDFNCGGFANGLEYIDLFIEVLTNKDIDTLVAPYIDIVVYFFTSIRRAIGESNESLISRMRSLLVRECEWRPERFGTPWDILSVFCIYLDKSLLYYIPNAVHTNIIVNGDFEDSIGSEWTILPSGDRSSVGSFNGSYCLDFTSFISAAQTVSVEPGSYILNSFIKPSVDPTGITDIAKINIQRNTDNKYFNTSTLTWVVSNPNNTYSTSESGYNLSESLIVVDGTYNITITYEKIVNFLLDRVELGVKEYHFFVILYIDQGVADEFASSWVDGQTPFTYAAFLDQTYMLGSATSSYSDVFYQSILDKIRSAGVKGTFIRESKI